MWCVKFLPSSEAYDHEGVRLPWEEMQTQTCILHYDVMQLDASRIHRDASPANFVEMFSV